MEEKWIKEIPIDMIPEAYKEIAKLIGVENTIILCKNFGGGMIYIPKCDSIVKPARDKKIRFEFDGMNYKKLAIKYNLSESTIRNIINQDNLDGQISFVNESIK